MLFTGTLYGREEFYLKALAMLKDAFGPVLAESPPRPWQSDYYRDELGWPITRRFVFFEKPILQDGLADIKLSTIDMEAALSSGSGRRINLDPGYLTLAKVVLASTKDYSHRIYLGKGICAEVTLYYQGGRFHPHVFTYHDFREDETLRMFSEMREAFRQRTGH
jgi:hypothetical protein